MDDALEDAMYHREDVKQPWVPSPLRAFKAISSEAVTLFEIISVQICRLFKTHTVYGIISLKNILQYNGI